MTSDTIRSVTFPPSRDTLRWRQVTIRVGGIWARAYRPGFITLQHNAVLGGKHVQQFRVMRGDHYLRTKIIDSILHSKQPRLNLCKCYEIVWLINKKLLILLRKKEEEPIQADKSALTIGELIEIERKRLGQLASPV